MSAAVEIMTELERLLQEERAAVLRLDSQTLDDLAVRKEAVLARLTKTPFDATHRQRLGQVVAQLKNNCLLLVHARELTKSLLSTIAGDSRRGVHVSVNG